jgi:hypothetical protein
MRNTSQREERPANSCECIVECDPDQPRQAPLVFKHDLPMNASVGSGTLVFMTVRRALTQPQSRPKNAGRIGALRATMRSRMKFRLCGPVEALR